MGKKRTLIILLLVPFIIGIITFVSVVALNNTVASDIQGIVWAYRENEGFEMNSSYALSATAVYDDTLFMQDGATELVFEISSYKDEADEDVAYISEGSDGTYTLITGNSTGECTIVCHNKSNTKSISMNAIIYDEGAIIINPPTSKDANSSLDKTQNRYYGQYDISYEENSKAYTLNDAVIEMDITSYGDGGGQVQVDSLSDNISFDLSSGEITIHEAGESYLTLCLSNQSYITSTYSFYAVEEGVNVYSYQDLMHCTNLSEEGEIVVMQISLGSRLETLATSDGEYIDSYLSDNIRLFGDYDFETGEFDFSDMLYYQEPANGTAFIDYYNEQKGTDYETQIKVGIRAQKDFYGNGFSINLHELAYPVHGEYSQFTKKLTPSREKDYFYGPLTYMSIGTPEDLTSVDSSALPPVIRAYLCDNIGLALEGDGITLNDLKIQNANNVDDMYNLTYCGTVVEAEGDDITIKNSIIKNGRTILRAFSCDNLLVDNCLLQNAAEFIMKVGSNSINGTDHSKTVTVSGGGQSYSDSFESFYADGGIADTAFSNYIYGSDTSLSDKIAIYDQLCDGLNNYSGVYDENGDIVYSSNITVNDTIFNNSGVYSIGFESCFNGPYLYNGMGLPEFAETVFGMLGDSVGIIYPDDIGGTSLPVQLTLTGETAFYDWKDIDDIDITALIEENFSYYMQMLGVEMTLSLESFFPVKALLKEAAKAAGLTYEVTDSEGVTHSYINRIAGFYGGGYNGSSLVDNTNQDSEVTENAINDEALIVDIASDVFNVDGNSHVDTSSLGEYSSRFGHYLYSLGQCVVAAIGTNPFRFYTNQAIAEGETPATYNVTPTYNDLIRE